MTDELTRDALTARIVAAFTLADLPITAADVSYDDSLETIEVKTGDDVYIAQIYSDDDGFLQFDGWDGDDQHGDNIIRVEY